MRFCVELPINNVLLRRLRNAIPLVSNTPCRFAGVIYHFAQSSFKLVVSNSWTVRDFAQERPGLYEAAQRAPDPDDPEWQAAGREVVEIMVRTLSAYALSPDEALHVVRMIRIIVHGCVTLENSGGFGLPLEIDETFRCLLDSLLNYLHSRAS